MFTQRLLAASETLAAWSIRAGGLVMFLAAVMIAADVLLRKLFSVTLGGADEMAGYAMAIACSWAFSYVLLKRGNVRVDALYHLLPAKLCVLLDLLAILGLGAFAAILAWYGYEVFATSWQLGSRSNSELRAPLWLPQGLWWLGLAQLVLTACVLFVRALALLVGRDFDACRRLVGARTIEEEAQAEASYVRQHEGEFLKEAA